jgi:hypothetical protein
LTTTEFSFAISTLTIYLGKQSVFNLCPSDININKMGINELALWILILHKNYAKPFCAF